MLVFVVVNYFHLTLFVLYWFLIDNTVYLHVQLQALVVIGFIDVTAKRVLGQGVIFFLETLFMHWQLLNYVICNLFSF
jgi:hypothetical protein